MLNNIYIQNNILQQFIFFSPLGCKNISGDYSRINKYKLMGEKMTKQVLPQHFIFVY